MKDQAALVADLSAQTWVDRVFTDTAAIVDPEAEAQLPAAMPKLKRITVFEVTADAKVAQRRSIYFYEDPVSKEVYYKDAEPVPILAANKPAPVVEEPALGV